MDSLNQRHTKEALCITSKQDFQGDQVHFSVRMSGNRDHPLLKQNVSAQGSSRARRSAANSQAELESTESMLSLRQYPASCAQGMEVTLASGQTFKAEQSFTPPLPEGGRLRRRVESANEQATKARRVDNWEDLLVKTCEQHQVVMVTGATGCGKSTLVAPALAEAYPDSMILLLQPRRLATQR
ncbi:hypothetical protein KIPB_005918 [Kipferlia bialata]|uniref:Uncharacterized protein n=1 Tax=Kipferlia bialata TaxID=797122 RepID=A0A9K3GJF3_9EUKA|nr:hypothetical protein KIPB_005918 [Kipferlia bialata]|eukprot:g5918.t1